MLLAFPFGVAAVLSLLVSVARPLHWRSQRLVGYCFLFATPWLWLLNGGEFEWIHSRWLNILMNHLILLWIPAFLYSGGLWLLLRIFRTALGRTRR